MRLADYVAKFLGDLGVSEIFMLSGTGSIYLDDAFAGMEQMSYICARHEAAAVVMAQAVSKLTGKLGVVVSTTGPGATNAAAGVVEAWVDSVPVLVISGQVEKTEISDRDRTFGIQGFDVISHVDSITKYAATVTDPKRIKYHLEKALYFAFSGRPGPVWLDIPMDLQAAEINLEQLESFEPPIRNHLDLGSYDEYIDRMIDMLSKAERPTVVFGQGIRQSGSLDQLKFLLGTLSVPAVSARMGYDILPYNHKNYMGMGGYKGQVAPAKIIKNSDLIISLGTSHSQSFSFPPQVEVICINIDEQILAKKNPRISLPIHADLKQILPKLIDRLKKEKFDFATWLGHCCHIKAQAEMVKKEYLSNPINSYYLLSRLDELSDSHHIFVNDAGSANYVSSQILRLNKGQRELTSGAFYSMGITIPLAIGAAACTPEAQIIAVTGDGSIELNLQELQTINLNQLNIKTFVINNGGYASIRESQDSFCGGRYTDDTEILDFSKVADLFNMEFHLVDDYKKIDSKITEVFSTNTPALIEVVCDPNQHIMSPYEEIE